MLALLPALVATASQQYQITDLGTLRPDGQGEAVATAINNSGAIVGFASVSSGSHHAFLRQPDGSVIDLGALINPAFYSEAYGLNEAGTVAGVSDTRSTGFNSPFRSSQQGLVELPRFPDAGDAYGLGINSGGVIVGWANQGYGCGYPYCSDNPGFAVRWEGTSIQRLGGLGGYFSAATAINDAGSICGYSAVFGKESVHAFILAPEALLPQDLGTLGGENSQAVAINRAGHVAGWAQTALSTNAHACLWLPTGPEDLGSLPDRPIGMPLGLNDADQVVGYCTTADEDRRATLFRKGAVPLDLNTLIPTNSGWVLFRAFAINDSGVIVGQGFRDDIEFVQRAFMLTPAGSCPPPAITRSGTEMQICWVSEIGHLYQLQSSEDFLKADWLDDGLPILGTGGTLCVKEQARGAETKKFYRVKCFDSAP